MAVSVVSEGSPVDALSLSGVVIVAAQVCFLDPPSHWFGEAGLRSRCDSPARSPRGARVVLGGRDAFCVTSAVDLPDRTVTGERDLLAVRRPRGLDRVDRRARRATEAWSVDADRIDLVMAAASIAVEGEAAAGWRTRWPGAGGAEPRDLTRSPLV